MRGWGEPRSTQVAGTHEPAAYNGGGGDLNLRVAASEGGFQKTREKGGRLLASLSERDEVEGDGLALLLPEELWVPGGWNKIEVAVETTSDRKEDKKE